MSGLLLKDLYNLLKQGRILLAFIAAFAIIAVFSDAASSVASIIAFWACFMGVMLPINALALDEKCQWDRFALTMPVSRRSLVLSKYLLGILLTLAVALLGGLACFISASSAGWMENLVVVLACSCLCLFILAINLPIMFKFGVEKGRLVFLLLFFLLFGGGYALSRFVPKGELDSLVASFDPVWLGAIPAGILVLLALSVLLSLRIYARREF